jgi:hypothetical protein
MYLRAILCTFQISVDFYYVPVGGRGVGWSRKFRETKFRGISCYFYFVFSRKFWENFRGILRNFSSRKCSYFVKFRGIPFIYCRADPPPPPPAGADGGNAQGYSVNFGGWLWWTDIHTNTHTHTARASFSVSDPHTPA